jgi:hypothetical protein
MTWRVGQKLGRSLYRDEVFVGIVDTRELAEEIVARMNARGLSEKVLGVLRLVEWSGRSADGMSFCCPVCRSYPDIRKKHDQPLHDENCSLGELLA